MRCCVCDADEGRNVNDIVNKSGNLGYRVGDAGLSVLPFSEAAVEGTVTGVSMEMAGEAKEDGGDGKDAVPKTVEMSALDQTLVYADGSSYKGQLTGGVRHGHGVFKSNTQQYTGEWTTDRQNGAGRLSWEDGRSYEGEFKDGKFDGKGRMEWPTPQGPMVFEGQYANDEKHGEGKFDWPDGRAHFGIWVGGRRHGKATFVNAMGVQRQGLWENDKLARWLDVPPAAPADGD